MCSNNECPICLQELNQNNSCKCEVCSKSFHLKCIHKWLSQSQNEPSCPLCRSEMNDFKIIKIKNKESIKDIKTVNINNKIFNLSNIYINPAACISNEINLYYCISNNLENGEKIPIYITEKVYNNLIKDRNICSLKKKIKYCYSYYDI